MFTWKKLIALFFLNYRGRTGSVPVLSLKVALCVMCSEKVQEKYTCRCTQCTRLVLN